MDVSVFLAALASALTHAGWNAAARARPDPGRGFACVVFASGVILLPAAFVFGLPPAEAWPWLLTGTALNLVSMRALMGAYRAAPFAVAYPVARGVTPFAVALAAWVLLRETPSAVTLLGIVTISGAVTLLTLNARSREPAHLRGLAMAVVSGLFAAGYTYADARGVRATGDIVRYAIAVALMNALSLGTLTAMERVNPVRVVLSDWRFAFGAGVVSIVSYSLVLFAFLNGPVGPVAALRETSVVFGTVFAAVILRESVGATRWVAVGLTAAGIALIRLG